MNLDFKPLLESKNLVTESIFTLSKILPEEDINNILVAEIDPKFADGMLLHEQYNVPLEMECNCLVTSSESGNGNIFSALLVPYGTKANTGSLLKQALNSKKNSFAPLDEVISLTKMEFGSITPIGLPENWNVIIDSEILKKEKIIIGGGLVKSKICISPKLLVKITNAIILDGLAKI